MIMDDDGITYIIKSLAKVNDFFMFFLRASI